jgi:exodeoxyribonuclease V gamma subunit
VLRLSFANRPEALADGLAADIGAFLVAEPLALVDVAVPHRLAGDWLRMSLSRRGVVAGLRTSSLRRLLGDRLSASAPSTERLAGRILAALCDETWLRRGDALAPLRAWLGAGDGSKKSGGEASRPSPSPDGVMKGDRERRRAQLAMRLAAAFELDGLVRPELLAAWARGARIANQTPAARWQARVFARVVEELGPTLELQLADAAVSLGAAPLWLFQPSELPRPLAAALHRIGDVRAFVWNPCREFWEDVAGDEIRAESETDRALAVWGRATRRTVTAFSSLANFDFVERWVEPQGQTLLVRLQRQLLDRAAGEPGPTDDSLAVWGAPSPRRLLERAAADIASSLAADPELSANQAAILIADGAWTQQQPLVAGALDAAGLPWAAVDVPLSAQSRVPEVLLALLALPGSRLTRAEVLAVVAHPLVRANVPDLGADEIAAVVERVGVFHGADRRDLAATYIERDLVSWDQGMRRLALGAVVAPGAAATDERRPMWIGDDAYLPEPPGERGAAMALLCRSLVRDARWLGAAQASLGEWLRRVRLLATTYLVIDSDDDRRALERCLDALDALHEVADGAGERPLGWPTVHTWCKAALERLRGQRGQPLAGGVVVAPLGAARGLPFELIYLLGLDEGGFPSAPGADPLDVLDGDRGPLEPRDRDRAAFLETLLAARRRLVLGFVDRVAATGESRAPSPVVGEMCDWARASAPEFSVSSLPAARHHDALVTGAVAAAAAERDAAELGELLRGRLETRTLGDPAAVVAALQPAAAVRVAGALGLTPPWTALETREPRQRIPLRVLRRFLECPLQGSALFLLDLDDDDGDDASLLVDERFEVERGRHTAFLREVLTRAAAERLDEPSLLRAYDAAALVAELAGALPTGALGGAVRRRDLATLRAWRTLLPADRLRAVRFGGSVEGVARGGAVELRQSPLVADGAFALVGRTEPLIVEPGGRRTSATLVLGRHWGAQLARDGLRAAVDQATLSLGDAESAAHGATIIGDGAASPHVVDLGVRSSNEARAWLGAVASDLSSGVHEYLLPFDAVFLWWRRRRQASLVDEIIALRDDPRGRWPSAYGPVRRPERYEPPVEAEARALAERRLGLILPALVAADERSR